MTPTPSRRERERSLTRETYGRPRYLRSHQFCGIRDPGGRQRITVLLRTLQFYDNGEMK